MAAFFADIEEEGVFSGNGDWGASVRVLASEARGEMDRIERELAALRSGFEPRPAASGPDLDAAAAYLRADLLRWKGSGPGPGLGGTARIPNSTNAGGSRSKRRRMGLCASRSRAARSRPSRSTAPRSRWQDGLLTAVALELYPTGDYSSFYLSEFEIRLLGRQRWPVKISLRGLLPDHEEPGLDAARRA